MQHIIGVGIGAIVTYLLLVIMVGGQYADKYLPAIIVGGIVALAWPWFVGLLLARRIKNKRDAQVDAEVARQTANKG